MKRARKGVPFILPLFILLPAFYFLLPISSESSDPSDIDSLVPVEVVAEGFKEPTGFVVDETGAVFVSDRKSGDVFKVNGEVSSVVSGLKRPVGLGFDASGRLLIVEERSGQLLRHEEDGSLTVLAGGMRKPRWVGGAEDGAIYVTAKGLREARDRDEDDEEGEHGEVILRLAPPSSLLTIFADGFKGLQGVVVHQNALFVAARGLKRDKDDHGGIFKVPLLPDGAAGPITRLTQEEIKKPFGLVVDALGAFYVSAEEIKLGKKIKDVIGKVASDSTLTRFASKLEGPCGLALDGFGNLYVADDKGDKKGRIIRLRAPPAPNLTVPAFTNQNPLTLTSQAEKNSRIDAFLTDSTNPTNSITLVTHDGSFSLSLPLTPNTQNQLSIFTTSHGGQGLSSAPAEFTIAHDNIVPLIANLQPANGTFTNNPRPLIRADFSDNLSGIDIGKVKIFLDLSDVTARAAITASGFSLDLSNCLNLLNCPLSQGPHTVSVTLFDRAGNSSSSSTFTVDVTPPLVTNLTPANGSVVSTARPLIQASFSDNLSGIHVASVRIFLDGADVTSQAAINASGFSLDLSNPSTLKLLNPLTQGSHTVSVSLSDLAGNPASVSSTFTVSLGPKLNPIGDKLVNVGSTLSFTVTATNPGGGAVVFSVAPLPLPAVCLCVNPIQLLHPFAEIPFRRLDYKVIVVIHEAVHMTKPVITPYHLLQSIQKQLTILVVFKYRPPLIAPGRQVIDSPRILDP